MIPSFQWKRYGARGLFIALVAFGVNLSCGRNDKMDQMKFRDTVDTAKLSTFQKANGKRTINDDYTNWTLSISDFFSEKFKKELATRTKKDPTAQIRYYCSFDHVFDGLPKEVQDCNALAPGLFDHTTGIFTWQPYVASANYEFWFTAMIEDQNIITFHVDVTVSVLQLSVLSLPSNWADAASPTLDQQAADQIPLNDPGGAVLVAAGMFQNPDKTVFVPGTSPQVDLSSLSQASLVAFLEKCGFDKAELNTTLTSNELKSKTDLIAIVPRSKMVIYESSIYLGAELSKTQFINLSGANKYQSLSTAQKQALEVPAIGQLPRDTNKIKAYLQLVFARQVISSSLGLPELSSFPGVSILAPWELYPSRGT